MNKFYFEKPRPQLR